MYQSAIGVQPVGHIIERRVPLGLLQCRVRRLSETRTAHKSGQLVCLVVVRGRRRREEFIGILQGVSTFYEEKINLDFGLSLRTLEALETFLITIT